jgi:hypothetical protein
MENLNPPPLNLVFSTRAASQEITVPSDATKKTFTIHSYRDTVVNGKVSKSDILQVSHMTHQSHQVMLGFLLRRHQMMQYLTI